MTAALEARAAIEAPAVRWLTDAALAGLLLRLAREPELDLIAPVETQGEVVFLPVTDPAAIARDYVNALIPPRDWLLPARERLLAYRIERGEPVPEPDAAAPPRPMVLFGVRSCDVAGLAYLERFMSGAMFGRADLADGPFMARREATVAISVVCDAPGPTCMCVCCKGGPALERGFDWQLTRLDGGWLVEIGSVRGARFAQRWGAGLEAAPDGAVEARTRSVEATVARFGTTSGRRVPTMAASRMVSAGLLHEAFWNLVGERCFECGGCAYVCPTCTCFNVADVNAAGDAPDAEGSPDLAPAVPGGVTAAVPEGRWERVRMRDCCMQAGFVRQAGGGYPRWTAGERCQTRFFHKLSQQFHARMGALGCTGCGRCVQVCLGEEGIDRVAEAMREAMIGEREPSARWPRTAPALGVPVPAGGRGPR